jgi:hypothetical protein
MLPSRIASFSLAVLATIACGQPGWADLLDACDSLVGWSAHPADGVTLELSIDDDALRMDFDIPGGGYAVARLELPLVLPENYAFRLLLRGEAASNHVEFKLIDASGENVWWSVLRDYEFSPQWRRLAVKKRHLAFAWGPAGGGEIEELAAVEIAITAGQGGEGRVWIDQIELVELAPEDQGPFDPVLGASSESDGRLAGQASDADSGSAWTPSAGDRQPWITLDLGSVREYCGLRVDWDEGRHAADYVIEGSEDGLDWTVLKTVLHANGGRDLHFLGEAESRFLRVRVLHAEAMEPVAMNEIALQPIDWARSKLEFFQQIARSAPRGVYPRAMRDEQNYWTVVGADFDAREGLLCEDGALEVGRGRFSIEPFLILDGRAATWADAEIEQSLVDEFLPIPQVHWRLQDLELHIMAFATGASGSSSLVLRYRVLNRDTQPVRATLALALRPFQVNPPSQTLNLAGGIASIHEISRRGRIVDVDGAAGVVALSPPSGFGVASFDEGDVVADYLRHGILPRRVAATDEFGAAAAVLAYEIELAAGSSRVIDILVPLYPELLPPDEGEQDAQTWVEERFEQARSEWHRRLEQVEIRIAGADDVVSTLRSQLAYLLVNRAGPALQPGTRSYARSWIRDGALSSWALLRCGEVEPARQFLRWYAPYQFESGKIPCVVDQRGADPVPEHDSSGEFIFLVAEIYRQTRDRALAEAMWPRVRDAASYLDGLRQQRRTDEYARPENLRYFGILPPSISHEGYSAKPMHSYWDDFFALRGFVDALFLARELGLPDDAGELDLVAKEFARDLGTSVAAAMADHAIDYVPGCADLGDFDPTSTTIALAPAEAASILPEGALERTFERYYQFFRDRRDGAPWEAFTPYELRNIGAFVRLGWRERAGELLDWFLEQRQPAGWLQWPEVVTAARREPRFLGDMPHSWVGSDYMRSVLDMLEYYRQSDQALVLAAGVQENWLEGSGLIVKNLPIFSGTLEFRMRRRGHLLLADIDGELELPPGGVVLSVPGARSTTRATVNGESRDVGPGGEVRVRRLPAHVVVTLAPRGR